MAQENVAAAKPFRRPQRLQHKRWMATAPVVNDTVTGCKTRWMATAPVVNDTVTGCKTRKQEKWGNLQSSSTAQYSDDNDSASCPTRSSTRAFATQDPLSASIDLLYSEALKSTQNLKLKKPEWLKQKRLTNASCSLSSTSAADFLSSADFECFIVLEDCASNGANAAVDKSLERDTNRKKEAAVAVEEKSVTRGYSLRSQRTWSESGSETPVSPGNAKSSHSETEGSQGQDLSPLTEHTSPVKTPFSGRGSGCRKRPCSDSRDSSPGGDTPGTENGRVNDAGVGLTQSERGTRKSPDNNGSGQATTDVTRTTPQQKRQKKTMSFAWGQGPRRQEQARVSNVHHRTGQVTSGRTFARRLHRERRRIVSRTSHLICSSCKHGFLRSDCLLCTSLETMSHTLVQKAKAAQSPHPVRKRCSTSVGGHSAWKRAAQSAGEEKHSVRGKVSRQRQVLCSGKLASCGKSVSVSTLTKQRLPATSKSTAHANRTHHGKLNRSKLPSVNKNDMHKDKVPARKRKPSSSPDKSSEAKEKVPSVAKRRKLSNSGDRTLCQAQTDADADRSVVEVSVIDYHKHLSLQVSESDATFASAKDVFSQLCQLEERSKDYDASTLHTIMPVKETVAKRYMASNAVSVYSRQSHVGGVWKSILS